MEFEIFLEKSKKKLLDDFNKEKEADAKKDINSFKHGTDDISQLQVVKQDAPFAMDMGFAAYNVFDTYHIYYTAHELEHESYSEPEDVLKYI